MFVITASILHILSGDTEFLQGGWYLYSSIYLGSALQTQDAVVAINSRAVEYHFQLFLAFSVPQMRCMAHGKELEGRENSY